MSSSSFLPNGDGWIERDGEYVFFLNNKEVSRSEFFKARPPKKENHVVGGESPSGWPLHSEALAVHPSQIQEAIALAKSRGVPTDFDSGGRPIFVSSRHFREYAKRNGFRHKGY